MFTTHNLLIIPLLGTQIIEKVADEEFGEPKDEEEEETMEERMRPKVHCGNFCCACWPRRTASAHPPVSAGSSRGGSYSYKKVSDAPDFALFAYPINKGLENWPAPLCKVKPTPAAAAAIVNSALHKEEQE